MANSTASSKAICFLLISAFLTYCGCSPSKADRVVQWAKDGGAKVHVRVGQVHSSGLRGTIAEKNFDTDEVLVDIPYNMTVELASALLPTPDQFQTLLNHQYNHPEWYKDMQPYWDAIPTPQEMSKLNMKEDLLHYLQEPSMESYIANDRAGVAYAYNQTAYYLKLLPKPVTLEDFVHIATWIGAYTFTFDNHAGQRVRYLIPVLDMLNSGNRQTTNADVRTLGTSFQAFATKPIKKGDEVRFTYNNGIQRNDHSIVHYGFMQDLETPLLACIDRPNGDLADDSMCPDDDSDYGEGGELATEEEAERLEKILKSFPTTEEEDIAILEKDQKTHKKGDVDAGIRQMFIKFRIHRKRALRLTIEKIRSLLAKARSEL